MHVSQKSYHNRILETKVLGYSPSFGKDHDDKVATDQLTAVDVAFMPHDNQKYPNSLDSHRIH